MSRQALFTVVALGIRGVFLLVLLELGAILIVESDVIPAPVPRYTLERGASLGPSQSFWADLNPHFGVWHAPGARFRHVKSCFDLEYQANAHGARDPERAKVASDARVVVLGDSMTEGYGVSRGERFTDLLEQRFSRPFLNFGTSGDFGPTQYHLMYRHLASGFTHDAVLIGLLPANDFRDDDIDFGRRIYADRYRPYWTGEAPDFELVYVRESLEAESTLERGDVGPLELLRSFSYAFNLIEHVQRARARSEGQSFSSNYYDWNEYELARMLHSLRLIAQDAGDRPVVLVMIPVASDVERHRAEGASVPPLTRALRSFAEGTNVRVIDLMPTFDAAEPDPASFSHTCDGHWTAEGHRVAAEGIAQGLEAIGLP